jgi:hypothetical protein
MKNGMPPGSLISKYELFIWEVVKAHVATAPKCPETVHYRGEGVFMISGRSMGLPRNLSRKTLIPRGMSPVFSIASEADSRDTDKLFARWCNGNTEAFGAFIHGSNPCRAAS